MTVDSVWNLQDMSCRNEATVHTVIVGPKDKVDAVKAECEKHNKGNWNNRE